MIKYLASLFSLLTLTSCSTSYIALDTAEEFDISKYMGKWYEIERLPNSFEEGLEENRATYSIGEDGNVIVINEGTVIADKSKIKQVKGKAWVPDPKQPGKLKVSFFWPFSGDYWVLKVDKDYTYALVGVPSGEYLWILARERNIDPEIVKGLKDYAGKLGFPVKKMISSLAD
ncbi:MAG: lipocalin family protein [Bacteroidales bacterium]